VSPAAAAAAAAEAEPASPSSPGGLTSKAFLVLLFVLWYASNIYFNIANKVVLKTYSFPLTGTATHLFIGTVLCLLMWLFRFKAAPKARGAGCAGMVAAPLTQRAD
jgi:hypothetical protein